MLVVGGGDATGGACFHSGVAGGCRYGSATGCQRWRINFASGCAAAIPTSATNTSVALIERAYSTSVFDMSATSLRMNSSMFRRSA